MIRGLRFKTVGPITANHMMIDVTGAAEIEIGDEVVLWRSQSDERITKVEPEELSEGAINCYRMTTRTPAYLPRTVVR